jgi:hypothetical protein
LRYCTSPFQLGGSPSDLDAAKTEQGLLSRRVDESAPSENSDVWTPRGRASVEVEEIFEQAAAAALASAALVLVVLVAAPLAAAPAFHVVEEVLVGVGRAGGAFFRDDLVELAAVEPDAAALRAGVDQNVGTVDLDEACLVVWAAQWLAAGASSFWCSMGQSSPSSFSDCYL